MEHPISASALSELPRTGLTLFEMVGRRDGARGEGRGEGRGLDAKNPGKTHLTLSNYLFQLIDCFPRRLEIAAV